MNADQQWHRGLMTIEEYREATGRFPEGATVEQIDEVVRESMRTEFSSEEEWMEYEEARGHLAGTPEFLPCYECSRAAGVDVFDDSALIQHAVVKLGGVVEARRDATQTYILSCGHTTI